RQDYTDTHRALRIGGSARRRPGVADEGRRAVHVRSPRRIPQNAGGVMAVLTKEEFLSALRTEIRIVLHLASKVEPAMLDYRPTPKQRKLLELLQYFTIVGPIHMRGALRDKFDMDAWRADWRTNEPAAAALSFEQTKDAIAQLAAQFEAMLAPCTDADL